MSPKQEIYREMLRLALPWIRNVNTWPWWRRCRDRSAFHESELIHNLTESLFEPDFIDHDIWFLNHQARAYHDRCDPSQSPNYDQLVALTRELFDLVPDTMRIRLNWGGPRPESKVSSEALILKRF